MNRRLLGASLLALWLLGCTLPSVLYQISRMECHFRNISSPDVMPRDIMVLKFPKSTSLNWQVAEKEFFWEGNLYDVVKQSEQSDTLIVYCFHDKKESEVVAAFAQMQKRRQKKDFPEKALKTALKSKFLPPEKYPVPTFCPNSCLARSGPATKPGTVYLDRISPPPEHIPS